MSKNVKVYSEVFEMLRGKNIEEMLQDYDATKVSLRQTDDFKFLLCANGRKIPFPKSTGSTRVFRVPEDTYDNLRKIRIHPEESFSAILFRLVIATMVAEKKPYTLKVHLIPADQCIVNLDYVRNGGESLYMHKIIKELMQMPEFTALVDIEYCEPQDRPVVYLYRGDKRVIEMYYQDYTACEYALLMATFGEFSNLEAIRDIAAREAAKKQSSHIN